MATQRILIPITNMIDPNFLDYTKELATEKDASLIILYITSPLSLTNYYTYPSMLYSIANMNMDSISMTHESFSHKIDELMDGFPHETICLVGPTTDTILHIAEEKQVDLIVIPGPTEPTSGKFNVKQKTDKLSKKTTIPVIVYPN